MWRLVPALVREMGQAYPELVRAEALITETLKLEETRFRKTLERGLGLLDEATDELGAGRHAGRRDRLQALRHLRLPARPDAGCAARSAASASTPTASTPRWSGRRPRRAPAGPAPARRRRRPSGSPARQGSARPSSSATTPRRPKASSLALVQDGAVVDERQRGRDGCRRRQPDAVLRRVRRPDRRHRHDLRRRVRGRGHRHAEEGRRPLRACRQGRRRAR